MNGIHDKLFKDGILQKSQYDYLEKIETKQLFSVFFELRTLLYIGVLLLTTGFGLIIYLNMGQLAHMVLIAVMVSLEFLVMWYILKHSTPYSNTQKSAPTPYFDYVLLFGALLLISIFSYALIQFNLLESLLKWSSLITALTFFYFAFRFDHRGILSLAITAFAAFWGLSLSPINWTQGEFINLFNLYNTGIIVGLAFVAIAEVIDRKNIKKHFAFTFKNFGLILFYSSSISPIIDGYDWAIYAWGVMAASAIVSIYSWIKQEYLFFVYGSIFGYIAFTRIFIEFAIDMPFGLWMIYIMSSMGGLVFMITSIVSNKKKNNQI